VREALKDYNVEYAVQDQQLGTGHAVQCAMPVLGSYSRATDDDEVLVLCGDGPLIRPATIQQVLDRHRKTKATATLATSVIEDPTGYGRIVRDAKGRFQAIVEQKNATPEQLKIREVNPSYYCFNIGALKYALPKLSRNAVTGEYYITDVPALLMHGGKRVEVIDAVPPQDVLSINTPEDLAQVDAIYRSRPPVSAADLIPGGNR
jgi:bifunctional UDP-N-acetylglucosamine pyrophosphorylase/glucosamine-1-phosphate N-acetyltransferase